MMRAESIVTIRLELSPLRRSDAEEMFPILIDQSLYYYARGRTRSLEELRERYMSLEVGRSPDDKEAWLNWIIRLQENGQGHWHRPGGVAGEEGVVAWVVGVPWQRQGYASEAAKALVEWLVAKGVSIITAHIHPQHIASQRVATRAGLRPTADTTDDGEEVWRVTLAAVGNEAEARIL